MFRSFSSRSTGGGGSALDRDSVSAVVIEAVPSFDTTKLDLEEAWLVVVA